MARAGGVCELEGGFRVVVRVLPSTGITSIHGPGAVRLHCRTSSLPAPGATGRRGRACPPRADSGGWSAAVVSIFRPPTPLRLVSAGRCGTAS
jgi:hypothetical protein